MVEFEWDEHNSNHIWDRHRVRPEEAEEALEDPDSFGYVSDSANEPRRVMVGRTLEGRLLAVVVTRRGRRIRVVTAREANGWEQRRYQRRSGR